MNIKAAHPEARIFIVDDAPENVKALTRILKQAGYRNIHSTCDARESPALYRAIQPHAVLLDLNMPYMDGFQVIQQLQREDKDSYIPVLMLTADSGKVTRLRALQGGAKDFLAKPFDRHEVIARINIMVEVSQLHERFNKHNKSLQEAVEERTHELQIEARNRVQIEEHARHLALHDTLTGLPNRILLVDRLQQCIYVAERSKKRVGVLMINLDRFQEINNTLGHGNGDALLQSVAERLCSGLRCGDTIARAEQSNDFVTIARTNGDEFVVTLPMLSSLEEAALVAQRIQAIFNTPFEIVGLTLDVCASISVVVYPDHAEDPETLLQRADVAMYVAKKERQGCAVYTPEQDPFTAPRLTLMSELRSAISEDTLELYFQPQIDIESEVVIGLEALVRWPHAERGLLLPDEFIPLAEETGVIAQLSQWVLRRAVQECAVFYSSGYALGVSVNLSANDLMDEGLAEKLDILLDEFGLDPEVLMLEVTESAMIRDPQKALKVITQVSQMGVSFSIDDFGTGYSSLAYLKKLPVAEIKIDKSFVRDMEKDGDDAVIVRSTIELAHNLGLKVVAEGIENNVIIAQLNKLGCDIGQGYHVGRPMSVSQLSSWLLESPWKPKMHRSKERLIGV